MKRFNGPRAGRGSARDWVGRRRHLDKRRGRGNAVRRLRGDSANWLRRWEGNPNHGI